MSGSARRPDATRRPPLDRAGTTARATAARPPALGRARAAGLARAALPALCLAATAPLAAQATHVTIVVGLGGTEEYRREFLAQGTALSDALVHRHGLPDANVVLLGERPEDHPAVQDRSTRANVLKALGELAGRVGPEDRVALVLIGHGTSRGEESAFNLPGPDLTPEDLAGGLGAFPTQALALVHTGSASGGFLPPLSGPRRVVVTATSTPRERNATRFGRFFVEAVAEGGADLDKDGRVSLLEAFEYAVVETARDYAEANELLTEHALLDDDGDGEGSRQPVRDGSDGPLAATFHFGMGGAASATTAAPDTDDPELARLYRERTEIQERLDALRASKESLGSEAYEERLEGLLVELALKNREIRAREGGST